MSCKMMLFEGHTGRTKLKTMQGLPTYQLSVPIDDFAAPETAILLHKQLNSTMSSQRFTEHLQPRLLVEFIHLLSIQRIAGSGDFPLACWSIANRSAFG